jgi:hypothetical protein
MAATSRTEVSSLLLELRKACRRPLYAEVVMNHSRLNNNSYMELNAANDTRELSGCDGISQASSSRNKRENPEAPEKTWGEVSHTMEN